MRPGPHHIGTQGATENQGLVYDRASDEYMPKAVVRSVVAGTNVTVDNTDPANPVVAATGGGGGSLTVQDENGNVATGVTQIDFQGAGVTATAGTGEVVVTIPGGGGGGSPETFDAAVTAALTGVVHRWKFDDASGTTVADSVGSLPLTMSGTYTRHVASLAGYATTFGASAAATASGLGSVPVGAADRCVIVLYRSTGTGQQSLIDYGAQSTRQWFGCACSPNVANNLILTPWSDDLTVPAASARAELRDPTSGMDWHLNAFGHASSAQCVYAYHDGSLRERRLSGALATANSGNFRIGGSANGGQFLGDIDDVIVLNNWPGKAKLDRLLAALAGVVYTP